MVKRAWVIVWAALAAPGCFDAEPPPECAGRVCGAVGEPMGGDGGAGGHGGAPHAGGHSGGSAGGTGGAGGAAGAGGAPLEPAIEITAPDDGDMFVHGTEVTFTAVASGFPEPPSADLIRWQSSAVEGLFGSGYSFSRALMPQGTHTITVRVMGGADVVLAEDSIAVVAQ